MTFEIRALFAITEAALSFTRGPAVLLVLSQKALLPRFIDPRGSVVTQVAILGVTSVVIEFFVLLAYGALAGPVSWDPQGRAT